MAITIPARFNTQGRTRTSLEFNVPNPTNRTGASKVKLCYHSFNQFFKVPRNAKRIRVHLTKRASECSYKMSRVRRTHTYPAFYGSPTYSFMTNTLDGHDLPHDWLSGSSQFKKMLDQGYKYVSVSYVEE